MKTVFFLIYFCFDLSASAQKLSQQKDYLIAAIGFWNVENLYDTLNDPYKNDDDFTPDGINGWTSARYWEKIKNLSEAISQMALEYTSDGVAILGLCEVENKNVVQDLINAPALKNRNYKLIHIEGPDIRGVDPSFVYNPNYFKVTHTLTYPVSSVTDPLHKTRDILVVSGMFGGDVLTVLVNHWPSRRGGEMTSRPNRNAAAKLARHIADSITRLDPKNKVLIMGDFNDDPVNESVKKLIRTGKELHNTAEDEYFNPMEKLYLKGIGTLAWQDSWNLFDQILLNKALSQGTFKTWQYYRVVVFNKSFLRSDFGNYRGYPLRTYSAGVYTGGYSDHFPVYIVLTKEK